MSNATTVFVGLDLGGRWTHFCVIDGEGEKTCEGKIATRESSLRELCARYPTAKFALETGTPSRWVAMVLDGDGHDVLVANARRLASVFDNPRKSDVKDAELLARLLRADPTLLHPVSGLLQRDGNMLALVRSRAQLVEMRTAVVNHVRGVAKTQGTRLPKVATSRFCAVQDQLPDELSVALDAQFKVLATLNEQIAELEATILQVSDEIYPETKLLRTIPGVGSITALYFVLVIVHPDRFDDPRDVGAYLGFVPRRDQSGDLDKNLGIAKTGDTYLRRLLIMAAHVHLRYGKGALHEWGKRKSAGGPANKKKAVVAMARKLSVVMHRLWQKQESFEPWPNGEPQSEHEHEHEHEQAAE